MSLLAPLFMAGLAAVSLPILFHLLRRTPQGRMPFSSLMFLTPSPPRLTRRSRLENWPLLLLRALALCLLALAFARPFLRQILEAEVDVTQGEQVIVLIDTSASMRRGDLWQQARSQAIATLEGLQPQDRASVIAFGRSVETVVSFEQWQAAQPAARVALAEEHMEGIAAGWEGTNLGHALATAADMLETAEGSQETTELEQPRRVVLISDLQAGAQLDALRSYEWPKDIPVSPVLLVANDKTNAGMQWIRERDDKAVQDNRLRVRVTSAADSTREQFRLAWAAADGSAAPDGDQIDVYVAPGRSRVVRAPRDLSETSGKRLVLIGDGHEFDNTLWRVPPSRVEVEAFYFGPETVADATQPLYYLLRAFPEIPGRTVRVVPVANDDDSALSEWSAGVRKVPLMVVGESLAGKRLATVSRSLEKGSTVLLVLRDAKMAETLAALASIEQPPTITEAEVADYAMFSNLDFRHPLLAPFADPRFGDFTKIHIWRHRQLSLDDLPGARVLASFERQQPALVELRRGSGVIYILTTGWQPTDSQLALSSKFVPLINVLLEQSLGIPAVEPRYEVGDEVELAHYVKFDGAMESPAQEPATAKTSLGEAPAGTIDERAQSATPLRENPRAGVRTPAGNELRLAANETVFSATDEPGIYTILGDEGRAFAVNLASDESKTEPLPVETLEDLGVRLVSSTASPAEQAELRRQMQSRELENQQKLWRWLLVAALVVLLIETALAGRMARRRIPLEGAQA